MRKIKFEHSFDSTNLLYLSKHYSSFKYSKSIISVNYLIFLNNNYGLPTGKERYTNFILIS